MTRKHFRAIADAIARSRYGHDSSAERAAIDDTAVLIAYALADANPNFDRARFLRACGLEA